MQQFGFILPRDFDAASYQGTIAVSTSATAVTVGDTELAELSMTNTTSATLTLNLTNTNGDFIMDALNVAANAPVVILWNPPLRTNGLKWYASSSGLTGTASGRKTTGWVLTNGFATSTGS